MRIIWLLLLLPFSVVSAEPSYIGFPADIDWKTRKSEHFQIIYRNGQSEFAARVLNSAERAYRILRPTFPDAPESTWIVLADFQDSLNGYSLDLPYPHMVLFASPPEAVGQLANLDHWLDSLVLHEYVHTLHLYPVRDAWSVARSVFGSWVLPIGLMPSHLHEGLATLIETEYSRGGRGRGSIFNMYRRMAVLDKAWGTTFAPPDLYEGSASRWPHGASPYFFGYSLYKELWSQKGALGIRSVTEDLASQWPYLFDNSFENVYGKSLDALWEDIYRKTRAESEREIAQIQKTHLSPLRYLTDSKFNKSDIASSPDGKWIAVRSNDPTNNSRIEILAADSGKLRDTVPIEPDSRQGLCWTSPGHRSTLYLIEMIGGRGYRTSILSSVDLATKERQSLRGEGSRLAHVLAFGCPDDRGEFVIYREHAGDGSLERWWWPDPKKPARRLALWKTPAGSWIPSIAENQGSATRFLLRNGDTSTLYRWSAGGDPVPEVRSEGVAFALHPVTDDKMLVISDVSGRNEIWEWNVEAKRAKKRVSVLGGIHGFAVDQDRWWVASYRHGGFDIARAEPLADGDEMVLKTPTALEPSPSAAVAVGKEKNYNPWSTLLPTGWIPSAYIVPRGLQIGALIPGFDVGQKNYYSIFGGYDTRGAPFVDLSYQYRFGAGLSADLQAYYFPSYIISTRAFLKRWGTSVGVLGNIDFAQALGFGVWSVRLSAVFKRLEPYHTSPANQSSGFGIDVSRGWNFSRRPLAIAPHKGTSLSVQHQQFLKALGSQDNYFSTVASVNQYLGAPWKTGHVWYASVRAGFTEGTSLINNYFQGGGELIFSQGRDFFLNRGFYPGTFLGRRMANASLEYLFPIARLDRGYRYWPLFLKQIHGAIVADIITFGSNQHDPWFMTRYFSSAGVEIKTDWNVSYYLPAVARVGIYHGFGQYGEPIYATLALEASL